MIIFKEAKEISGYIKGLKISGKKIGFVPTMGALHAGHISLVAEAKTKCDITVASIFVNPTQFNDPKDFEKYPSTLSEDIYKLEDAGCDILFCPDVNEIYPNGLKADKKYELGYTETILEGKHRPGHFQGVCQVVHLLLNIIQPDYLFLGQKDYQQCIVIKQLTELENIPVQIVKVATRREPNGLAMSSRNMRLTDEEKSNASIIFKLLNQIKNNINSHPIELLINNAHKQLLENGFYKVDYVSIADADTLEPLEKWDGKTNAVALIAAFIGDVRLIDNMVIPAN